MSSVLKWKAGAQVYSSGNLADNTALASRSSGYFNRCQVGGSDVVIGNDVALDKYLAVTIELGSWTPTVNDMIELYALYAPDGTNYESGSSSYLPTPDRLFASAGLSTDTSAAAKRIVLFGEIKPFKTKILWRWRGTNATAASSNLMTWQTFNDDLNG